MSHKLGNLLFGYNDGRFFWSIIPSTLFSDKITDGPSTSKRIKTSVENISDYITYLKVSTPCHKGGTSQDELGSVQ